MTGKADYRSMAIGFCVCELTGSHLRLHKFWDGKYEGKPIQQGDYLYFIEVLGFDNERFTKQGTINLIY